MKLPIPSVLVIASLSSLSSANPTHHAKIPKLGAVASESNICSKIGTDILVAGGNAADALVGTVFCIGVVGMYHSGVGGGGFMLVRSSKGAFEMIDFRESAPAAAFEDMYKNNTQASITGGLASGIPGELRGLEYLHKHYGKLPWRTVMKPAIKVARDGWTVGPDLLSYMKSATSTYDFLTYDPSWAIDFAPNGTRLGLGDTITRRRYSDTLETISKRGADAFYTGPIANATINALRRQNGTMTLKDLADYKAKSRKALEINYRDYRVVSCGAPSSGVVGLSALKVVEGYKDLGEQKALNISTHRLDEAIRFGYGERAKMGDPSFVVGLDRFQEEVINSTSAAFKRSKISDDHTFNVSHYDPEGFESLETPGTSHIVTADKSGMAITLTTTVNLLFGSQLVVPETGVIMNNEMNDFSIPGQRNAFGYEPSPSNFVRPGKRPLSSISPTIVEHLSTKKLYYVVGAAGGSRIITSTIQNLWHTLDHKMDALTALTQARFHDQLIPNVMSFEWAVNKSGSAAGTDVGIGTGVVPGFDNRTVAFLKERGHNVTFVPQGQSAAQAIRLLENGTFEAAGEPRQKESGGFAV